jgi:hypothetical protein
MEMYYAFIALTIIIIELFLILNCLLKLNRQNKKITDELEEFRLEWESIHYIHQDVARLKNMMERVIQDLRIK